MGFEWQFGVEQVYEQAPENRIKNVSCAVGT
jgi:hypothetical protein